MTVICGGVIPPVDYDYLFNAGVDAIFGPGTKIPEAVLKVIENIRKKVKAP
jgi:methylmalonyl-CoA mutase